MKKENKKENNAEYLSDDLWIFLLFLMIFWQPAKPQKTINIYMGDE